MLFPITQITPVIVAKYKLFTVASINLVFWAKAVYHLLLNLNGRALYCDSLKDMALKLIWEHIKTEN